MRSSGFVILTLFTRSLNKLQKQRMCTHLDYTRQTKVSNLDVIVITYKDIPRRKVPVDVVLRLQVRHATSDLSRHINQGRKL